jgi:hypothetical protein
MFDLREQQQSANKHSNEALKRENVSRLLPIAAAYASINSGARKTHKDTDNFLSR